MERRVGYTAAVWRDRCESLELDIDRLQNLAADLMDLADEMPIKHPQQAIRRDVLRNQCRQFIGYPK